MYIIPLPRKKSNSMWYGILVTSDSERLVVFNPEQTYYVPCLERYVYVVECDKSKVETTSKSLQSFCDSINEEYGEEFYETELRL